MVKFLKFLAHTLWNFRHIKILEACCFSTLEIPFESKSGYWIHIKKIKSPFAKAAVHQLSLDCANKPKLGIWQMYLHTAYIKLCLCIHRSSNSTSKLLGRQRAGKPTGRHDSRMRCHIRSTIWQCSYRSCSYCIIECSFSYTQYYVTQLQWLCVCVSVGGVLFPELIQVSNGTGPENILVRLPIYLTFSCYFLILNFIKQIL